MARVALPTTDAVTGATITAANWQILITALKELGWTSGSTPSSGVGTLDNANMAAAAAIQKGKIADTALVQGNTTDPGTQTITRPTAFTGASKAFESHDTTSTNKATTALGSGVSTFVVATGKRYQLLTFDATVTVNAAITTITGATVGDVMTFIVNNSDAAQTVTFTHSTATTANAIKLLGSSTSPRVATANSTTPMGTFVFGDLAGSGTNQWWEV